MKRVLIGTIVGGVILFLWNFVSWVVLPWHNATIHSLPGGEAHRAMFQQQSMATGVYWFPEMPAEPGTPEFEAAEKKQMEGGFGMVFYQAEGAPVMPPEIFPKAFALDLLCALVLSMVMWKAAGGSCGCYPSRLMLAFLIGLIPGAVRDLPMMLWMHVPMHYTLVNAADALIGFTLMGLVLAGIVKQGKKPAEAAEEQSS